MDSSKSSALSIACAISFLFVFVCPRAFFFRRERGEGQRHKHLQSSDLMKGLRAGRAGKKNPSVQKQQYFWGDKFNKAQGKPQWIVAQILGFKQVAGKDLSTPLSLSITCAISFLFVFVCPRAFFFRRERGEGQRHKHCNPGI